MSTLYEAAQELKKSLENDGSGTATAYEKTLMGLGAKPATIERLMTHPNPAAISDYAFACLAVHVAAPK